MKQAVQHSIQFFIRAMALVMLLMAEWQELAATVLTDMVVPQPAAGTAVPQADTLRKLLQTGVVTADSEVSEIRKWLKAAEQFELRTTGTRGAGGLPMGI